MIEAQSRYLNALVAEVIKSRQQGKTLAFKPEPGVLQSFNDRIQAVLRSTSFADPNCNSWYKQDDGVITNNWSGTAIDYQVELSKLDWKDYVAEGTDKGRLVGKSATKLGRVHEESVLSDRSLIVGAVGVLSVAGYYVARSKILRSH
jgi:hypothetical protein